MSLPLIPDIATIKERLPKIFTDALENRSNCIGVASARTIQVMFYAGAIESDDRWIRPSQVTDMTNAQMSLQSDDEREAWCKHMLSNKKKDKPADAWYAPNTREQVRDDAIRYGLVPVRAVVEKAGVPTTSSKPRYALSASFALLFDPALAGTALDSAIEAWQKRHLSKAALARQVLLKSGAAASASAVNIALPNGTTINLSSGPSSVITKAVIEHFSKHFLHEPALLWVSESSNKIFDDALAKSLGIKIDASANLPDVILVDMGDDDGIAIVFIEVVHSDGPINQLRKDALEAIAVEAGFEVENLMYVTAFADRGSGSPFKTLVNTLAWDTYVWFASEPECVIVLKRGIEKKLTEFR